MRKFTGSSWVGGEKIALDKNGIRHVCSDGNPRPETAPILMAVSKNGRFWLMDCERHFYDAAGNEIGASTKKNDYLYVYDTKKKCLYGDMTDDDIEYFTQEED